MFQKITGMFAVAALLFGMSSCSDELDLNGGGKGDLVQVSFTITQEGVSLSRAGGDEGLVHYPGEGEFPQISDGSKAKRLIWAVYDKNGNLLPELGDNYVSKTAAANDVPRGDGQVVEDVTKFPHTITLSLVRGQEYSFAFWAQDKNCTAFNTNNLRAVTIDYKSDDNKLANDERRDAFCKVETFTVTSAPSMERTIILRRPFAQVNVGIPASEYEALRQSGIRIAKSKIHMENVATEFDVVANSTHGEDDTKRQAIDFEYNWIPAYYNFKNVSDENIPDDTKLKQGRKNGKTQDLKIDLDHDGKIAAYKEKNSEGVDETYNYMLMAYILPADRNDGTSTYSTTLDKVEFSLLPEDSGQTPLTMSLENVPVQRNWRTNIFGNMFTSQVTLKIDLDPFYAGDYNYPDWQRIFEGVTYDGMEQCILISNGIGLKWLSSATNGKWETKEDYPKEFDADLLLKAAKLENWPKDGCFNFDGVDFKLQSDIDLANIPSDLLKLLPKDPGAGYFEPIGFGQESDQSSNMKINEGYKFFSGNFDGCNHTIYNLKTPPVAADDGRFYGLFGLTGRSSQLKNIRLKDVEIRGHFYVGGIVGNSYSDPNTPGDGGYEKTSNIHNCYVDGGIIESTSWERYGGPYDDANGVGGIIGQLYKGGTITDCFVRNVTIRAYRSLGGIMGQKTGDYGAACYLLNNKVYDVTLIVDQFQEYVKEKEMELENVFYGRIVNGALTFEGNTSNNVKVYAFIHYTKDGKRYTDIGRTELLSNPPLDIFPRLVKYTDIVNFQTSILGGPSAWKVYDQDDANWKGTPDTTSGRVGLYVSGITLDGDQDSNPDTLDNSTVTASGLDEGDCVLFVKDEAVIKNLTFHSDTYIPGQAICLKPADGKTITLENVLAYDAKYVLADDGGVEGGNLVATNCNFRGYVKLSDGYSKVTFTNTVFDGSTKRVDETTNKLELGTAAALTECTFIAPFEIEVPAGSTFKDCYVMINGDKSSKVEVTGNMTATIVDNKLVVEPK